MSAFKIASIQYGWFKIYMGRLYAICSDYLKHDAPGMLLKALINLVKNDSEEEWICWQDEPGAAIMQLEKVQKTLQIRLFSATETSDKIHFSDRPLEQYCGECLEVITVEILSFLTDVLTEFSLYENGNGRSLYETHWMTFPVEEFNCLKALARTQSKGEELFFDTY